MRIKRLETERFAWHRSDDSLLTLSIEQLHWLLEGIDLAPMRGHRPVHYRHAG
jgi:transposase